MQILRMKTIVGLLLCVIVLAAGYLFSLDKQPPGAKVNSGVSQEPLSPPPLKLEEILATKQEGAFAGDHYDKKAVEEKLQQMPKGLSDEETYAYLLSLVGESYVQYRDTIASLENPNSLATEMGTNMHLLSTTDNSVYEAYMREKNRLDAAAFYLRDQMDYKQGSLINQWVLNRWTLLKDYHEEKYQSISSRIMNKDSKSNAGEPKK